MNQKSFNRQFSIALEALTELQPEIDAAQIRPMPAAPDLDGVLAEIGPMPREALFLGVASDGLPVLLNLHDGAPGPILIAGDPGTGKTAFLRNIARSVEFMHRPEDVQYGVLTNYPDEWVGYSEMPNCVGVFRFYQDAAIDFLYSLSGWVRTNKSGRQSVLLLMDDLESIQQMDFDVQQTFRYLLLRGPARRMWPIVTVNADDASLLQTWLELFRTRVLGRIQAGSTSAHLAAVDDPSIFDILQGGLQFALREGDAWIKFWIPT